MAFSSKFKEKTKWGSKKKNSKQEKETWILEGIVDYLRNPTWTVPVINFIEQYCEEFEDKEENKFIYTSIHKEYKEMVERLMKKYTEELEITPDQFSRACEKNEETLKYLDGMFEYIWAGDDFLLFKDIMLKRNVQIEKETLDFMQNTEIEIDDELEEREFEKMMALALRKSQSDFHNERIDTEPSMVDDQEDAELNEAIRFSRLEMERMKKLAEEEKRMMDEAISLSLSSSSVATSSEQPPAYQANGSAIKQTENTKKSSTDRALKNGEKNAITSSVELDETPMKNVAITKTPELHKKHDVVNLPDIKQPPVMSSSDAAQEWLNSAVQEIKNESSARSSSQQGTHSPGGAISPEEMAKRKAHLKEQRQRILEFKKQEREKELDKYMEEKNSKPDNEESPPVDPATKARMNARRALADKLKREVVNKR